MNRDIRTHLAVSPRGRDETARPANAPFDLDRCEVVDRPMGTHVVEPVHPVQGVDNWRHMQPSECRGIPGCARCVKTATCTPYPGDWFGKVQCKCAESAMAVHGAEARWRWTW